MGRACPVRQKEVTMEGPGNNVRNCALVFEGGGYRASYTAGIVRVLLEQGIDFDYACGVSAGASHAVDYVSRDLRRTRMAFLGHDGAEKTGGVRSLLSGKGYFNADYLYEGAMLDGFMPFDWDAFVANPARIRIQAFERDTGRTVTWTKDDMPTAMDMMDRVRASSTLPGAMKPLPVSDSVYYDGGLGTGAGIPIHLAEGDGFEKFVFVATRPRGYRKPEPSKHDIALFQGVARDYPYMRNALLTRWKRYNVALDHVDELERDGRCLAIYPDEMPVENGTVNKRRLLASYNMGHDQGERDLPRLREFVFGSADGGPHRTREEIARLVSAADGTESESTYITIE